MSANESIFPDDQAPLPGGGSMSKAGKYGWMIHGQPGEFVWLSKEQLHVDHEYQRDNVNRVRVLDIASHWSWPMLGVLCVALRPDGVYWVYDGQHRKLAADKHSGITLLPCMVFKMASKVEEAAAFIGANVSRGPMRAVERFKAEIMAGDALSLRVKVLVEADGYTVASGGAEQTVSCITTLKEAMRADEKVAEVAWRLAIRLFRPKCVTHTVFSGIFVCERHLQAKGTTLWEKYNAESLLKHTVAEIERSISSTKDYHGVKSAKAEGEGIVRLLNYKRTTRRLPSLFGEAGSDA